MLVLSPDLLLFLIISLPYGLSPFFCSLYPLGNCKYCLPMTFVFLDPSFSCFPKELSFLPSFSTFPCRWISLESHFLSAKLLISCCWFVPLISHCCSLVSNIGPAISLCGFFYPSYYVGPSFVITIFKTDSSSTLPPKQSMQWWTHMLVYPIAISQSIKQHLLISPVYPWS